MSFDPAIVAAFVDGQLDDLTARRIEREAQSDAALAAEIARHRALKTRLAAHFAPVIEEEVPERLRSLLVDPKLDTSLAARRETKQARFGSVHWGALAAVLVLGLTIGLKPWMPAANVGHADGRLIASGALASALDTQLASDQTAGANVRIGLTFRDRQGRTCRSFEGRDLSGIGCRDREYWVLERTMTGQAGSDYRQASSGALAADVAKMMAGDALDAAAERAERQNGWSE